MGGKMGETGAFSPVHESNRVDSEEINLEHAVALELAERLCTIDEGVIQLEMGCSASRLVSREFRHSLNGDFIYRIGLVYRQSTYFDNAAQEPVEEVQILRVEELEDGDESQTVMGVIRHNQVHTAHGVNTQEELDNVMSYILEAKNSSIQ